MEHMAASLLGHRGTEAQEDRPMKVSQDKGGRTTTGPKPGQHLSYMMQHLVLCAFGSLNRSLCLGRYFSR